MRKLFAAISFCLVITTADGQDTAVNPRPLTMAEYDKALSFHVKNLDSDTYVKFENAYILDRYESRKPYFVTGADGLKKRIDLYKLIAKEGRQEIGLMIYYTNETGKMYPALRPDFTADARVWAKYFQAIDDINKTEKNYILKLSYVLSKEMSFQQYKMLNGGKDMKDEAATYGTDICFPGDEEVTLRSGARKAIRVVKAGDQIVTVDPVTRRSRVVTVKGLTMHPEKNYAITELVLAAAKETATPAGIFVDLTTRVLRATPNHPIHTRQGDCRIGDVSLGQEVLCLNDKTNSFETFRVLQKTEHGAGVQAVYNIEAAGGTTLLMNGVMVLQK